MLDLASSTYYHWTSPLADNQLRSNSPSLSISSKASGSCLTAGPPRNVRKSLLIILSISFPPRMLGRNGTSTRSSEATQDPKLRLFPGFVTMNLTVAATVLFQVSSPRSYMTLFRSWIHSLLSNSETPSTKMNRMTRRSS